MRVGLPDDAFFSNLKAMELHFTPKQQAQLAQMATDAGTNPEQLVTAVVARYLDEESRFIEAVKRGEDALQRGEYVSHEQVGRRLERFLRS